MSTGDFSTVTVRTGTPGSLGVLSCFLLLFNSPNLQLPKCFWFSLSPFPRRSSMNTIGWKFASLPSSVRKPTVRAFGFELLPRFNDFDFNPRKPLVLNLFYIHCVYEKTRIFKRCSKRSQINVLKVVRNSTFKNSCLQTTSLIFCSQP